MYSFYMDFTILNFLEKSRARQVSPPERATRTNTVDLFKSKSVATIFIHCRSVPMWSDGSQCVCTQLTHATLRGTFWCVDPRSNGWKRTPNFISCSASWRDLHCPFQIMRSNHRRLHPTTALCYSATRPPFIARKIWRISLDGPLRELFRSLQRSLHVLAIHAVNFLD